MKASSAKAKGRRLQQWVCKMVSRCVGKPWGKDQEIASREMGQSGTDVRLIGEARKLFPFACECKYQENWSVPAWVKDAKDNLSDDLLTWLLFIKRNRHEELVVMDAQFFFDLWYELLEENTLCIEALYNNQTTKPKRRKNHAIVRSRNPRDAGKEEG